MGILIKLSRLLSCFEQKKLMSIEDLSIINAETYYPIWLETWDFTYREFKHKQYYIFMTRNPHHPEFFILHSSYNPRSIGHKITTYTEASYGRDWRVYTIKQTTELCDILNYNEIKDRISS